MKISVDASIVTPEGAAMGRMSGVLQLASVPVPGAFISFQAPLRANAFPPSDFIGQLKIESVVFSPGLVSGGDVLLMLEDLVLKRQELAAVEQYLLAGFEIVVDVYES